MPSWYPSQTSFNGGEITGRMLSRVDSPVYKRSVLRMRNFMPRLQGQAIRTPATTYYADLSADGSTGRCIPFLSVLQERSLVVLQPDSLQLITGVSEPEGFHQTQTTTRPQIQLVANSDFDRPSAEGGWLFSPPAYTGGEEDVLGCRYVTVDFDGVLRCICRDWKYPQLDNESFTVTQTITVSEPNDSITFDWQVNYVSNPGLEGGDYVFTLKVGSTPGGNEVLNETITGGIGTITERVQSVPLPGPSFTGDLFVTFECTATAFASTPIFDLTRFKAFIDGPELPPNPPVFIDPAAVLYAAEDLKDIQFVQSAYDNKELVLVHPQYPPQWLYYNPDTGRYVFEPMTFVDQPGVWGAGNYPSACTAYQGRLILAGTPRQSETLWGSRPGDWLNFSQTTYNEDDPPITDKPVIVTPDSAIEITTVYRSPIQWVYGHKDLMVGTLEFEYLIASDTGLLQAGDIDVRLHSTHGSLNVQPASFGKFIAFAAEQGTRTRAMQRVFQDTGWVAPDLSLMADHLLASGIRRVVRMRNPHQMLVCLLNSGDLAILHWDEMAELYGWSTVNMQGVIVDVCVSPVADGTDVLFALVSHVVDGQQKLYLEGIFDWVYGRRWSYVSASRTFRLPTPGNVVTGLGYLEGQRVQVLGDRTYLGTFIVENGQVVLADGNGNPYNVSSAEIGLPVGCQLILPPPITDDMTGGVSSFKRYSDIVVRTVGSTRPIINGDRPRSRDPLTPLTTGQLPDILRDNNVANLGTDNYAFVTIEETAPLPVEVVSVSGKLTSDKL